MIFRKTIVTGLLSFAALAINALPSMARPAMIDPAQRAGVNVRSGPSVETTAIDSLPAGASIEVLNIINDRTNWYYVRSSGRFATEGWVAGELIRFKPSSATYGTLTGDPGDNINIRSAPSTTSSILHTGVMGDLVSVGRSALVSGYRWYVVVYPNGSSGWVRADLISVWPKGCIITCPDN
jgi:uncharacterized protein YgiM (DUF1202 family)